MSQSKLISLKPVSYEHVKELSGKEAVKIIPMNGNVDVELKFRAIDIVNEGRIPFVVEHALRDIVVGERGFKNIIPNLVGEHAHAYLSNAKIIGTSGDSPFTFDAGLSDLAKGILRYMEAHQPGLVNEDHMRIINSDEPIYNFQIVPTKGLFPEGHPAQVALDDLDNSGDVYEHTTSENIQEATPHDRFMSAEIMIYKGVTENTIRNSCFSTGKQRRFVATPTNSLIASALNHKECTFQFVSDNEFAEEADMLAVIPLEYAAELRSRLVKRSGEIRTACMRDVRELKMNFAARVNETEWRYDAETHTIVNLHDGTVIDPLKMFHVRVRINLNALYVNVGKTSISLTYSGAPMFFPKIYKHTDITPGGSIRKGAQPIYIPKRQGEEEEETSSNSRKRSQRIADDFTSRDDVESYARFSGSSSSSSSSSQPIDDE